MYNYSKNLTYKNCESDTQYRKELLECFYLTEYSNDINNKISKLYDKVKEYYIDIIELIRKNNPMHCFLSEPDDITCFTFLFSWEFLIYNHKILQGIESKSNIHEDINVLKVKIESIYSNKK